MDLSDAVHLLKRSGIGASPSDIAHLASLTRREGIDWVLDGISTTPINAMPDWVSSATPHYWAKGDMSQPDTRGFNLARDREIADLRQWWVREMIETTSPQTERLVLLWHNHFVSGYSSIDHESTSIARQNQLFRREGSGSFRTLLQGVLRDAAMLNYLDNRSNKKRSPNENLAREFLELFTLGEGTYDEQTVKEAARALTGWTVSPAANMSFTIDEWQHDAGEKTLFGVTDTFDGDLLIDLVLSQPESSVHIAKLFWRHYVSEMSADSIAIQQLADRFRASDFDLKTLLKETLSQEAFWNKANRGTIIKSPVDLLIGTARTIGRVTGDWQTLPSQLSQLGQSLFDPPNVAGWPGAGAWVTPAHLYNRDKAMRQLFQRADGATAYATTQPSSMNSMSEDSMGNMMLDGMMSNDFIDNIEQGVSIKLAAENYKGPSKFKVELKKGDRTLWSSKERKIVAGLDTERYGRLDTRDLPWHTLQLTSLDVPRDFDRVVVSFLNDKAGPTGDRNVYIDWVIVNNKYYLASDGNQLSACPPKKSRNSGALYCDGTLEISATQKTLIQESDSPSELSDLQIDNAYLWGLNDPKKGSWREMSIGLTGVTFENRNWHNVTLRVVDSPDFGFSLLLKRSQCWQDCVSHWPDCAHTSQTDPAERRVLFPITATEDQQIKCQWDSLAENDKRLIGALFSSLPEIISFLRDGRRAQNKSDAYRKWEKLVKLGLSALDNSPYKNYITDSHLVISKENKKSVSEINNLSPLKPAGQSMEQYRQLLQSLLENHGPSAAAMILNGISETGKSLTDTSLVRLISDPTYQLR